MTEYLDIDRAWRKAGLPDHVVGFKMFHVKMFPVKMFHVKMY